MRGSVRDRRNLRLDIAAVRGTRLSEFDQARNCLSAGGRKMGAGFAMCISSFA